MSSSRENSFHIDTSRSSAKARLKGLNPVVKGVHEKIVAVPESQFIELRGKGPLKGTPNEALLNICFEVKRGDLPHFLRRMIITTGGDNRGRFRT